MKRRLMMNVNAGAVIEIPIPLVSRMGAAESVRLFHTFVCIVENFFEKQDKYRAIFADSGTAWYIRCPEVFCN